MMIHNLTNESVMLETTDQLMTRCSVFDVSRLAAGVSSATLRLPVT